VQQGIDGDGSGERLTDRLAVGVLTRLVSRDLVDEVVAECGRREQRLRLLPARVVVYYVMALCLFYSESYEEVMRRLVGGLRALRGWGRDWRIPSTGAISQARDRLGEEPMKLLFERVAAPLATRGTPGAWYQGFRVMALDGVVLDVPDTPDNDAEFGRVGNNDSPNTFPQVRLLALAECGTHAIIGAAFGPICSTQERDLIPDLLPYLEPDMLVLADRGFYSYRAWTAAREQGTALLWRVKETLTLPVLEALPDGSYRSDLLPREVRREANRGRLRVVPEGIPIRVIEYMIEGRGDDTETYCLITSIMDHELAPAAELAALYHERWEIELIFDEIETHQIGTPCRLRSRTPKLVKQEIWALLLTHYATRSLMAEAADAVALDPDRLSFIRSLRLIRRQVSDQAAFSPYPTSRRNHRSDPRDH
jgi:Insertion element 4 transposase N-terminal/Transposase DDE domain